MLFLKKTDNKYIKVKKEIFYLVFYLFFLFNFGF